MNILISSVSAECQRQKDLVLFSGHGDPKGLKRNAKDKKRKAKSEKRKAKSKKRKADSELAQDQKIFHQHRNPLFEWIPVLVEEAIYRESNPGLL